MAKEIAEEYASSLSDLTVNSKPLINMLTILAEENIDHAGVIVETVEKHLEKVPPEIKLPVLYLVDSIIKNVGGAYTQKFAQSIVNMFTRTFKQVDEKVRSQMFKLRETWHEVFPASKLYQLDVKVNLIDPAWPIQAQPQPQSNIHNTPATSSIAPVVDEDDKMRSILAKKEQELLMLQRKKIEMELEQTRKQLEMAEKNVVKKVITVVPTVGVGAVPAVGMQVSMVNPMAGAGPVRHETPMVPVKSRLGPPVHKPPGVGRIAPVSGALAAARRDPRLQRHSHIAPHVFDIKPLHRGTKRKNVITFDVQPDAPATSRDPSTNKRDDRRTRRKPERNGDDRGRQKPDKPEPETKKEDVDKFIDKLLVADPKRINKLPPIPKLNRGEDKEKNSPSPIKKKNTKDKVDKKKKKDNTSSSSSSPEKKCKSKENSKKTKRPEEENRPENEVVAFKELKNYHKERYMRRNKEKSESPETLPEKSSEEMTDTEPANGPETIDTKDVDLRVFPVEPKPGPVAQKRSSTETIEIKTKKNKMDKFDKLFGNEDVDLRQLPQVEEITSTNVSSPKDSSMEEDKISPQNSPKMKDWHEVKEKSDDPKKTPTKLDLVRAKLAEATKGKDRLGRPLLFSKSPSEERERRRTISSEDTDLRPESSEEFDADDHKKTISIIMNQAKEQFSDGQINKGQYNTLMYQVLQLNEKLKLKEAKQRESFEISKRKLKAHIDVENHNKVPTPKSSPNTFGDIDERVTPAGVFMDTPPDSQGFLKDSDMRVPIMDAVDGHRCPLLPLPPAMPMGMPPANMFMPPGPFPQNWRGQRPNDFGMRRFRGPSQPFFRGKFDARGPRPSFDRMPLPTPQMGNRQGEYPLPPYDGSIPPPPLGAPGIVIPPTDFTVVEYIDQDPVKTIQIDGIPREIRFYGETAVIMLDWDDPREIRFLPGSRRVTFDNKDSVVISFNEPYKQVEIDDQVFDIRFGAPTRELFINGRWFECFFGGQPLGVIIDGKPRLVHLEGPLPQVDIGKTKRTDLVAGKINLIVNATQMCPVYLDAKVQKFAVNGQSFTIRFVDALQTVLINEQPFKVEFGDLPKPILVGNEKYFIRFSALPRNVKPGHVQIANMEGSRAPNDFVALVPPMMHPAMEVDQDPMMQRPEKTPSPEGESQGLEMLASVMPSSMPETPASASAYSVAEPLFSRPNTIPGLETSTSPEDKPPVLPMLGNLNVTDLFAKLVATGIVKMPTDEKPKDDAKEDLKAKVKEDKTTIHHVDLLKSETLRVKQPGVVRLLYGGMQCSGCGARFPPEHTVRYSQHLDWHFRQNRRERDSARRAHSRHWHYDITDWLQYEELEDAEEREKSWFETCVPSPRSPRSPVLPTAPHAAPSAAHCALCGDRLPHFYNEDAEEWHLRNAVLHHDQYYHPACLDEYKASLTKKEEAVDESISEVVTLEPDKEEAIEIKDLDDTTVAIDDDDVEVVEPEQPVLEPPVEIDEADEDDGDEDDVVLKADPVEQVTVEDEDTDDELAEVRAARDEQAKIDIANVKVKQEPIDPDDEPIITHEEEIIQLVPEPIHTTVLSSIDGNVQLESATATATPLTAIRINISKSSLPSFVAPAPEDKMLEDISADDEPLPPGEEPELEYTLKPTLEGVDFSRQPPVQKGNELSGLCSIM